MATTIFVNIFILLLLAGILALVCMVIGTAFRHTRHRVMAVVRTVTRAAWLWRRGYRTEAALIESGTAEDLTAAIVRGAQDIVSEKRLIRLADGKRRSERSILEYPGFEDLQRNWLSKQKDWLSKQQDIKNRERAIRGGFTTVAQQLLSRGKTDVAADLCILALDQGLAPGNLLRNDVLMSNPAVADRLIDRMKVGDLVHCVSILLDPWVVIDVDRAEAIVQRMVAKGIPKPIMNMRLVVVSAWRTKGDVHKLADLLAAYRAKGLGMASDELEVNGYVYWTQDQATSLRAAEVVLEQRALREVADVVMAEASVVPAPHVRKRL
ncbi:hypothetical protein [Burkholderia vietnamiensis]|uniref:hypothetical protein n=1 Tax=Burkholderia vietnamiensis TaxID=60552 RepID=UPI001CF148BD|nr:hypothetical protein [Burkholderia vietnamiensis]MCA8448935.1 hypothetical protein [Burkholderia vietnamiensis]